MGSSAGAQANVEFRPQPQPFRFFISYAREDYDIAIALSNTIQTATGPAANVFMDLALPFGVSFEEEIKTRLDETNVLVVINSAVLKSAFSLSWLGTWLFYSRYGERQAAGVSAPNRTHLPGKAARRRGRKTRSQ